MKLIQVKPVTDERDTMAHAKSTRRQSVEIDSFMRQHDRAGDTWLADDGGILS